MIETRFTRENEERMCENNALKNVDPPSGNEMYHGIALRHSRWRRSFLLTARPHALSSSNFDFLYFYYILLILLKKKTRFFTRYTKTTLKSLYPMERAYGLIDVFRLDSFFSIQRFFSFIIPQMYLQLGRNESTNTHYSRLYDTDTRDRGGEPDFLHPLTTQNN